MYPEGKKSVRCRYYIISSITYVLAGHALDEDFGVLVDEDVWLSLLGVGSPEKRVDQLVALWLAQVFLVSGS